MTLIDVCIMLECLDLPENIRILQAPDGTNLFPILDGGMFNGQAAFALQWVGEDVRYRHVVVVDQDSTHQSVFDEIQRGIKALQLQPSTAPKGAER